VFEGYDHMQYQIRDPRGFAQMLRGIIEEDRLPALPFLREYDREDHECFGTK